MLKFIKKNLLKMEDIEIKTNTSVENLKNQFFESFGTNIKVYKTLNTSRGAKLVNDEILLGELSSSKNWDGDFYIKKNHTVGAVEDQFKDKLGIGIQVMLTNGVEFAPNDSILSEVKDIECKEIKEKDMALNISGRMKVKTLKSQFKDEFGLSIRIYDGRSFADDDATLASIRKGDSKGGEFSPRKNTKVGNLEDKIEEMFGIKTQISGSDDSYLCNNDLTLKAALEEDVFKMERKEKKAAKQMSSIEDIDNKPTLANEQASTSELTEEERIWLDDLWSLDEAPESIRDSKTFMLEAVKEIGSCLEYGSDKIKNDKDIVLAAVNKDDYALEYASNGLKQDKDILIIAISNNIRNIEYASEIFKSDEEFALELFKSMNEKEQNNYNYGSEIQYFEPEIFKNEAIIEEICKVTPSKFIAGLLDGNNDDTTRLDILTNWNDKFSKALYKEFNDVLSKAKEMISEEDVNQIKQLFSRYDSFFLSIYNENFELISTPNRFSDNSNLYNKLHEIIQEEIVEELEDNAHTFEDYAQLISISYPSDKFWDLFVNIEKLENYYENLLSYIDESVDLDYLLGSALIMEEYWNLEDDLPNEFEQLIDIISERILKGNPEDILSEMSNYEWKLGYIPEHVKEEFVKKLSNELIEEYDYLIDELRD